MAKNLKISCYNLSPLRKDFEIIGKDAEFLMNKCRKKFVSFTRNIKKLVHVKKYFCTRSGFFEDHKQGSLTGQVVYSALCYPTGGMLDEGTIFKMSDTHFRWIDKGLSIQFDYSSKVNYLI